ncbi:hypothetical protein CERZMDRAFT_40715 [Cercospora zeae-maydis SCOH1-5]|uniref:Fe2OG dioxygenase domain-containing protein n=1 Tax=Cercospora zeae-maydis SCOH1-5 TaxID=717836 RepID=A0A6A6FHW4_9PEZI|nr:hypothetical protein CERZMDRAFT_40715 [Cercospora zeae-maydis SCOH1-5]
MTRAKATLPPGHPAQIRELETFDLPVAVTGSDADRLLGLQLVDAWRKDGIVQIAFPKDLRVISDALKQSKKYFIEDHETKAKCVDPNSFAGYIASGEELTDGIADYSEIFTVTKEVDPGDPRVVNGWPCHGPNPWPSDTYAHAMLKLMDFKASIGDRLLQLISLGLDLEDQWALSKLTQDGWHHMRVLRFPATHATNGKGKEGRGIGSHTDYGLLVIASQDEVGGLFIRPPTADETYSNWKTSTAGLHENDDRWLYVAPQENVFTVFPGDMMQFITNSYLPSTPHKVALNTRERFAFAYFHEPNFNAVCRRLPEFKTGTPEDEEAVHYGTHFTNMFMRNYNTRITANRMREEKRMDMLPQLMDKYGFGF